ncbi:MAG: riboflavin synthase [Gammaproteobacteria bacterium]|nr:riboflavin synthase [Gammaproteobacteria bacterium]
MFTGIITAVGEIRSLSPQQGDLRVSIAVGDLDMTDVQLGDSIAVNGVCLTATAFDKTSFSADVSGETLALTGFAEYKPGQKVNLEKALTPTTRLGGHLVSGHVDGRGTVRERWDDARSTRFVIEAPAELARYIAHKGSITVDGVSLTVNKVDGARFELNIVPHTLSHTVMGSYQAGSRVNLEVDLIARYLERLLLGDRAATAGGISEAFLAEHGFMR